VRLMVNEAEMAPRARWGDPRTNTGSRRAGDQGVGGGLRESMARRVTRDSPGSTRGWRGRPGDPGRAHTNLHRYPAYPVHFISVNRVIEPEFGSAEEGEVNCREALANNRTVEWPDPAASWPKHLGRWHGNGHDAQGNWWHLLLRSRTLRPGDSLERLMVQLRRPMKIKDGELEYLEMTPRGTSPRLRSRFVVHTGAEGVRRVVTFPMLPWKPE
jgi:hypothetical protein